MTVQELLDKLATVTDRSMQVVIHVPERDGLLGGMSQEPIESADVSTWTFQGRQSEPTAFEITVAALPR